MLQRIVFACVYVMISVGYMPAGAEPVRAGSPFPVSGFLSPRVSMGHVPPEFFRKEYARKIAANSQTGFIDSRSQTAGTSVLALARELVNDDPAKAAVKLRDTIPDKKKWTVLKKLPPQKIATMLDTLSPGEAARILQLMRPLKAGLVLNEARRADEVYVFLEADFQRLLRQTPGPRVIVHMTIEAADFFRCGGLADVLKNLPRETAEQGDVPVVMMPLWPEVDRRGLVYAGSITVPLDTPNGWQEESLKIYYRQIGDLIKYKIFFLENNYFNVDPSRIFSERVLERFVLLGKAGLEALRRVAIRPDVIHCHEWQTGLVPVYVQAFYREKGIDYFDGTRVVYTSHNPAYDMKATADTFYVTGLDADRFLRFDALEINGEWSFAKAGLQFADAGTTVGRSIAHDIQTQEFIGPVRNDLRQVYRYLAAQGRWHGILNGANEHFRAEVNPRIAANFDVDHLESRVINKLALQRNVGLEVAADKPVIGMVGRLTEQKGYDLLLPILLRFVDWGAQFVSLGGAAETDPSGWGMQNEFKRMIHHIDTDPALARYRGQISMNFMFGRDFDDGTTLEALISSGADIGIVPSKFEPCGLVQMNFAGCGGVVVAKKTQGLADTVTPFDPVTQDGLGFLFEGDSTEAASRKIFEAIDIFRNEPDVWRHIQKNNMNADFSWDPVFWEYRGLVYTHGRPAEPVFERRVSVISRRNLSLVSREKVVSFLNQSL